MDDDNRRLADQIITTWFTNSTIDKPLRRRATIVSSASSDLSNMNAGNCPVSSTTIRQSCSRAYLSPARLGIAHGVQSRPIQHSARVSTNATQDPGRAREVKPLSAEQQRFLESALRVNHAGELAATLIYTAQTPPIIQRHPNLRPLMKHMYDQEAGHFKTFNELLAKHRIRPTAMYPVWQAAATVLGWGTGVMGREAAMACTEAVETEIGEHYNSQVKVMMQWMKEMEARGEDVGDEIRDLVSTIKRIRDEELEHLDHAVENDAKEAQPYGLLTNVIRSGCRGAIWISEKI